ncbi:MAG: hypothetical protein M9890_14040 [Thermomicrobiales bacterium]|nr:hypothetical protein [Thermomicrobiales bacterium]
MINPSDLDIRLLNHAAQMDAADRFGALLPVKHRPHNGPGSFVLQIQRRLTLLVIRRTRSTIRSNVA